ncbi:hypothetical protein D9V86_01925 [Bacteroidetes/Chlorobi group bacterium ChocPot_Mid]|jgi:hypothetical protein|nr:MAG: hypothetical protein D9V86_01925 [Bacteroidetes/Chlorobi group bacterium ChocPot_Mid]
MEETKIINENELKMNFSDEEIKFKKDALKNIIRHWKNKEFAQLIRVAQDASAKLPQNPYGSGDKELSEIYYLLASAMKELKYNNSAILDYALKAAHFNRLDKNTLWLIREVMSSFSDKTQLKRIQVKGKISYSINSEIITDHFKTIYTIAAENNEEAMTLIKEFEREEIAQHLEIVKVFDLGPRPELPKGIYETMKLMAWFELNQ